HVVLLAGLEHVSVDQNVVLRDVGQECGDVTDSAHVGRQVVDLIDIARGFQTVLPDAQVKLPKIVGCRLLILRLFNIHAANPVAIGLQPINEMMTNESTGTSYQNSSLASHVLNSP